MLNSNLKELFEETISIDDIYYDSTGKIRLVKARYVEKDGEVYLEKDNGTEERIGSLEYWERINKFKAKRVTNINTSIKFSKECLSCGLCTNHKNKTALLNIVLTNRCDLRCWYCFFYSEKSRFVYEPSLEEIEKMLISARRMNGYTPPIQLTGGEPTLRKDLKEIIELAKKYGSPHIQLNTNSVSIGIDYYNNREETVKKLKEWRKAGLNSIYTSFDGLSFKTNPKNYFEIPYAFKAYRESGLTSIVLVPTILKSNLHEVADIIRFAVKNSDIVRGVNFQPISLVGMASKSERDRIRVVQSDIVDELKKLNLAMKDFFPVSSVQFLADLIGKGEHVTFYNNEKCGLATYLFFDEDGSIKPITTYVDVDGFLNFVERFSTVEGKVSTFFELGYSALKEGSFRKALLKKLKEYIIEDELPSGVRLSKILENIINKRDYKSLGDFHYNSLFVGMMHFMDPYNYDVNRVQRCSIHYGSPDGRIIPFCTFNVFPNIYRDSIMKVYRKDENVAKDLVEEEKIAAKKVVDFRKNVDLDYVKSFYKI